MPQKNWFIKRHLLLGGYSCGLISENALERSHKVLRKLAKNHTRKGRIDLISWDALNHMWNFTSPKQRNLKPKKPRKPLVLETADDYEASWSPIPNLNTHLSMEFTWIRDLMHSIHIHLKCNLVNFDTPNVFRVPTVEWFLDIKIDKNAFQMNVDTMH